MEDTHGGCTQGERQDTALGIGCVRGEPAGEGLMDGWVELEAAVFDTAGDAVAHFETCDVGTDGDDFAGDVAAEDAGKLGPEYAQLLDACVDL